MSEHNVQSDSTAALSTTTESAGLNTFLANMVEKASISQAVMLVAKGYMERLPTAAWETMSRKELIAACVMLAHKYSNDNYHLLKSWHAFTKIPEKQLTDNEVKVLSFLNYDLHVKADVREPKKKPVSPLSGGAERAGTFHIGIRLSRKYDQ